LLLVVEVVVAQVIILMVVEVVVAQEVLLLVQVYQ
jgi:hypothetical protein